MIIILKNKIFSLLSRETSSGNFIPEIDGMRFLAIGAVILFHFWGNFAFYATNVLTVPKSFAIPASVLGQGELGVEVFFLLSGFILAFPFASHHLVATQGIPLTKYFKRRVIRLEPPYLLSLFLCFFIYHIFLHRSNGAMPWSNLIASCLYVHNVVFGEASTINCVAWSLEIEIQFYILAPFLSFIFAIRPAKIRRILLIGGILIFSLASDYYFRHGSFRLTILNYIQYFLSGFLLVDVYLGEWNKTPVKQWRSDIISATALAMLFSVGLLTSHRNLFIPWLALLVVMGAFRGVLFNRFFTTPWIYTIGGMCYTIYLYHFLVIGFLGHGRLFLFHSFWLNLILSLIIVPCAILVVSAVLFVLFEKPFMRRDWHIHLFNRIRGTLH